MSHLLCQPDAGHGHESHICLMKPGQDHVQDREGNAEQGRQDEQSQPIPGLGRVSGLHFPGHVLRGGLWCLALLRTSPVLAHH